MHRNSKLIIWPNNKGLNQNLIIVVFQTADISNFLQNQNDIHNFKIVSSTNRIEDN